MSWFSQSPPQGRLLFQILKFYGSDQARTLFGCFGITVIQIWRHLDFYYKSWCKLWNKQLQLHSKSSQIFQPLSFMFKRQNEHDCHSKYHCCRQDIESPLSFSLCHCGIVEHSWSGTDNGIRDNGIRKNIDQPADPRPPPPAIFCMHTCMQVAYFPLMVPRHIVQWYKSLKDKFNQG